MNTKSLYLWRKYIICIFIYVVLSLNLYAQDSNYSKNRPDSEVFSVQWIGQFSSSEDFTKKAGLSGRIMNFITGKVEQKLFRPTNVLANDTTFFWILDQGSQNVKLINKNNNEIEYAKSIDFSGFPSLVGICRNENQDLLFTDSRLNKIFILNNVSKTVEVVNDTIILDQPTGIAYSTVAKQIWVSETAKHRILVLDENGNFVKYIGKRGTEPGEFNFPTFIWIDNSGKVYIVDSMNFRIQMFSADGVVANVFGETGDATGNFARPKGIAVDSYGHIYVVDALFNTVQIFDDDGTFLYNFGKQGRENGEFWMPSGIYIDNQDIIYVADSYNSRIQIFQLIKDDNDDD